MIRLYVYDASQDEFIPEWIRFTHEHVKSHDSYGERLAALGASDPEPRENYIVFESESLRDWFMLRFSA